MDAAIRKGLERVPADRFRSARELADALGDPAFRHGALAGEVREDTIRDRMDYEHPVFLREGVAAQQRHAEISGVRGTYYAGAWWGFGFHEDGVRSAHAVVRQLGGRLLEVAK